MFSVLLVYSHHDRDSGATMETPLMTPLGLPFLAASLIKNGFDVTILDNSLERLPYGEIVRRAKNVSLVGLSCMATNVRATLGLAQDIKNSTKVPLVVGGPHPTICPFQFYKPFVDYICVGEGEQTLVELCTAIRDNKEISLIKGLIRRVESTWISSGNRERIRNLDDIPHPARDLLSVMKYRNQTVEVDAYPVLSINSSRGCPFSCTFCSVQGVWGRTYRAFSVSWILDEIHNLITKYGAKGIYFYEDNFTMIRDRVEGLCNGIIQNGFDIKWACEGRIGSLSSPLLKKMKAAGCQTVKFGIESGSQRILDLIKKEISLEEARSVRAVCQQTGLKFAAFFLIGTPTETDTDRQMTLEFIKELKPDIPILNIYTPFPGSPLYHNMLESKEFHHMDDNGILYRSADQQRHLEMWIQRMTPRG